MTDKERLHTGEPEYAVAPGVLIFETLECIGMTQKELALRLDLTPKIIDELVKGKARISSSVAEGLANTLGSSAGFWLKLEAQYRANLMRTKTARQMKSSPPLFATNTSNKNNKESVFL